MGLLKGEWDLLITPWLSSWWINFWMGSKESLLVWYCCLCTVFVAIGTCCSFTHSNPTTDGSSDRPDNNPRHSVFSGSGEGFFILLKIQILSEIITMANSAFREIDNVVRWAFKQSIKDSQERLGTCFKITSSVKLVALPTNWFKTERRIIFFSFLFTKAR